VMPRFDSARPEIPKPQDDESRSVYLLPRILSE